MNMIDRKVGRWFKERAAKASILGFCANCLSEHRALLADLAVTNVAREAERKRSFTNQLCIIRVQASTNPRNFLSHGHSSNSRSHLAPMIYTA